MISKEQIVSGRYYQKTILAVGLATWRALEAEIAPYRRLRPDLVRLAAFCAQKGVAVERVA